jgi:hydrogenase-4 component F
MGLISIAIGIGSKLALIVALLHIWIHALTKAMLFFSSGILVQQFSTQTLTKIRALFSRSPVFAGLFLFGLCALLGLPPSGLFVSELLLILAVAHSNILLMLLLIIGLMLAFFAIILKVQPLFFGQSSELEGGRIKGQRLEYGVIILHLGIVMIVGLYVPLFLFEPIAVYLGGL